MVEEPIQQDPNQEVSEEEAQEYLEQLGGMRNQENATSVFSFLQSVIKGKDTKKAGFVTAEELGLPFMTIRGALSLADFCSVIKNPSDVDDLYALFEQGMKNEAEITLATSLSREGKLMDIAQTRKQFTKNLGLLPKKRGWFGKKQPDSFDSMTPMT